MMNQLGDISKSNKNNVFKKITNIICKILLIISFISIIEILARGENKIIIYSIIFILATIGVLKTNQKKSKIFLILSISSIGIGIILPIIVMLACVTFMGITTIIGGFRDINFFNTIINLPSLFANVENGILIEIILIIIALSFMFIHKKQKVSNK